MNHSRTTSLALLILRVSFGLTIAAHGLMKLPNWEKFVQNAGGLWLAVAAVSGELLGGLGLAAGLFTRLAAAGMAAVMFGIAFRHQFAHLAAIGTAKGNAFEYPFLVGVLALSFVLMGAGAYSLDALLRGRGRRLLG